MKKKKRKWPRRILILMVSVILVLGATFFGVLYAFDLLGSGLNSADIPEGLLDKPETKNTDRLNFLMIGTDGSNSLTDTLLFISFDMADKKINITSIPRDTRVNIRGGYHKINSCIAYGKEELLFNTIREITGAPIHFYAKVNFSGFRNVVDILGGVDFDVPRDMKYSDPYQNLYINLKKGPQHLDGDQAEQLVRFRRYAEGDIQRTRVQQDFIKALIKQKLKPEYLFKATSLYSELTKHVVTNFSPSDLVSNLKLIKIFQNMSDETIATYQLPGVPKTINSASYYIHDVDATLELFKEHFGGSGTSKAYDTYAAAEKNAHAVTVSSSSAGGGDDETDGNANEFDDNADEATGGKNSTNSATENKEGSSSDSGKDRNEDKDKAEPATEPESKDNGTPVNTNQNGNDKPDGGKPDASGEENPPAQESQPKGQTEPQNDISKPPAWLT